MAFEMPVSEISALSLKQRLDKGDPLVILDVREPHELQICKLDRQIHIPLGELAGRLQELEPHKQRDIIVYCRSGARSAMAAGLLISQGFKSVTNLKGGILSWAEDVDWSVKKY